MSLPQVSGQAISLLTDIRQGHTRALARGITLVENDLPGAEDLLKNGNASGTARVVGITGPPGAGKSTLVNALIGHWLQQQMRIAVVAVDPSSPFNFGALLGDRIRLSGYYTHPSVFIRSLASRGALGGLHPNIVQVIDLLREAPFDRILIETVGVGQSEVEIAGLADCTVVVMVPEGGDDIQTMKSGVLEIADVFVVNKGDRPGADAMVKRLRNLAHENSRDSQETPVVKTVAAQNENTAAVAEAVEKVLQEKSTNQAQRKYLLTDKIMQLAAGRLLKKTDRGELEKRIGQQLEAGALNVYREADRLLENLLNRPL